MDLTCITIEGGLLAPDFLEVIAEADGQKPVDFGITDRRTLVDDVSAVWSDEIGPICLEGNILLIIAPYLIRNDIGDGQGDGNTADGCRRAVPV